MSGNAYSVLNRKGCYMQSARTIDKEKLIQIINTKQMMKRYIGIAVLAAFTACNSSEHTQQDTQDSTLTMTTDSTKVKAADIKFAEARIERIFNNYLVLKNILVSSKASEAQGAAKELALALNDFPGCENTALIADKISNTADLKSQRKEFTALSSDIIALFEHAELKTGAIYVQHCPMANNGDGGDWVSSEQKIRNPYYGDSMLECGSVLKEIKAKM